jgi:hypothetical protein
MQSLTYQLSGSDIEQVARIQRDYLKPETEKDIVSVSAQLGAYTTEMDKGDKAKFEHAAFSQVIEFQSHNNRPPTSKERQAMFDGLMAEVVSHTGMAFDSRSPLYKLPAVATDEDFNKLPKGAHFVGPDGKTRVKPR